MSLLTVYKGAVSCTGGPQPGAKALMSWVLGAYGPLGARNLGIYNCRTVRGGSTTSLHGEGRALDFGFPLGDPDGNVLAEALMLNSAELGVQCVIYERRIWSARRPNEGWRDYHGVNTHVDHSHVELSWWAAGNLTVGRVQSILGSLVMKVPTPQPSNPKPISTTEAILRDLPNLSRALKSQGHHVKMAQAMITSHGSFRTAKGKTKLDDDGDFGGETHSAVVVKRRQWGLPNPESGRIDADFWRHLLGVA